MRLFREELDVDIYAHGGEVTFTGDADKVALARLTLEKLLEIIPARATRWTARASATPSGWPARATPTASARSCATSSPSPTAGGR